MELYDAAFTSLSLPNDVLVRGAHNSLEVHCGVLTNHSKDAQGPEEHGGY